MSFLQKFKKTKEEEENTSFPAPPDGVRLEFSSFGQGMPSYLAPNVLLQGTSALKEEQLQQQQSKSTLRCFSSTTNTISYQGSFQSETVVYPPTRVSQEVNYSYDNSSAGKQQQSQQNHQAAMKQMRGKPNFMKKTYNQTVNAKDPITANNIQKRVDFKADNKTISDMAGKAMSSSSNSNNFNCKGYLSTPLEGVSKSGRFSVLDPLALLDESDLNFPEIFYPKKIVNDVAGIGGMRLKQSKEQLQQFLDDSQSMAPCIVGSLLIHKLLSKQEQPNIVRYRSLFACEILAKSRTDCRAFFKRNQIYLQQSQSVCTDDSKYIMLSNQLLASLNNPSVQLETEIESKDIDFTRGIDLQKFIKNREEEQDQIVPAKTMTTQTTNLLDLIAEENKDESRINNSRDGIKETTITDNHDDIFESNTMSNNHQKTLFKKLHKKQYQQQKQPEGNNNSINVIDMLDEEDIKQYKPLEQLQDIFGNMEIKEDVIVVGDNEKQQDSKLFGKYKKNKIASQDNNELHLSSNSKEILDLLDDHRHQQQQQQEIHLQQHKNTREQHLKDIKIHQNQSLTQPQQIPHSQYIQYVQQQPLYQYGFQGGYTVAYPYLQPYLSISQAAAAGGLIAYSQPQSQVKQHQQQYQTIAMDFTAQHLEVNDNKEKHSAVDDLLNHALIDKDNFQIHRESPVNKSKEKTINEQAFDFITL